jgi:peroxiredoxin
MIRTLRTLLFCFGVLGIGLHSPDAEAIGETAPAFSLRDIDGKQVSLSDFKGKVVLVNFWATWCQPCQVEMPHLQKMHTEFADQGFVVLSISIDEARGASMVKPLIKRHGYTFPVLLDKDTSVVSLYNPSKTLPYTAVLDRQHKIQGVHQGYNPGDEVGLRAEVEALLKAPQ